MSQRLPAEIDSFIETVSKQIAAAKTFVEAEDWSDISDLYERMDVHNMQFLFTERNVKYASQLSTKASQENLLNHPKVRSTVEALLEIFSVYEARYEKYIGSINYEEIIQKRKTAKTRVSDKEKPSRKRTKVMDDEMKFQSDISTKMIALLSEVKKIHILDSTDTVVIPTYNDAPIPLAMKDSVESKITQLREFMIKKRAQAQNETKTISGGTGKKGTGVSSGSEE